MVIAMIQRAAITGLLASILLQGGIASAQSIDNYDPTPKMRSYLQRPATETEKYVENVSVPTMTDSDAAGSFRELLPERRLEGYSFSTDVLIDRTVEPDKYVVGAGDRINVYLWGELDKEFPLVVSPEGLALVPTVGPVPVADITLAEAQERIMEKVREKYHGIKVTIYLAEPRQFRVSVSGVIENPGMYTAHAMLRVSDLLGEVVEIDVEEPQTEISMTSTSVFDRARGGLYQRKDLLTREEKKGSSKRAITITRGDKVIPVDLLRFERLGDIDSNPYVAGGDHIDIPQYKGDLYISGEVNDGGIYEFREGDKVADLVKFGGGLTAVADTANATLVRFSDDGRDIIHSDIDLYDALFNNPDNPGYLLRESDRVYVQTKYKYKVLASVKLDGQVRFPGEYPIVPQKTKLSDVVRLAGGFSEEANLEEARIIRPMSSSMRDLEYERLQRMLVADMTEEEYEYFKHRSRIEEGMISIDFVRLFRQNDLTADVFLEDEDEIFIPLRRELINVLGAVQEPGYVKVEPGQPMSYYIELAGGYNWNARKSEARIIKARTGQRLKPRKAVSIEGGDTIHIPEKKPVDYWQLFKDSTQLFANMATLVIIARRISE